MNKKIDLVSFGGDGCNILFSDRSVESRTIKDMRKIFRERTFEECEGTDFWRITKEEERAIKENTTFDQLGKL